METSPSWDREPSSAGVVTNLFQFAHVLSVLALKIPHHLGSCPVQGKLGWLVSSFCRGSSGWSTPFCRGSPGWSTPGLRESSLRRPGMQSHLQGNLALQSLNQGQQQSLGHLRLRIQAQGQRV